MKINNQNTTFTDYSLSHYSLVITITISIRLGTSISIPIRLSLIV